MLKLLKTRSELQKWRQSQEKLGFVPTMGNLHKGHLSLVEKSLNENPISLVSIFINPTQFNDLSDFDKYPRTLEKDLDLLETLSSEIVVFSPDSMDEVYPKDFDSHIIPGKLSKKLCGQYRQGHFEGVCDVVYNLFSLTKPTKAYFGEKDYQQFLIIKKMVQDLSLNLNVISCPLIREESGLALSSRNNRLNASDKEKSLELSKEIKTIVGKLDNPYQYLEEIRKRKHWEYLEVLDASNLEEVSSETKKILIAGAMFVGDVRLIDNNIVTRK